MCNKIEIKNDIENFNANLQTTFNIMINNEIKESYSLIELRDLRDYLNTIFSPINYLDKEK
jgi:hypothetical protein